MEKMLGQKEGKSNPTSGNLASNLLARIPVDAPTEQPRREIFGY